MLSNVWSKPARLLATALWVLLLAPAHAADTPPPATAPDTLSAVRTHVAAKRWAAAVQELKRVGDTGNADWNNLMGYSLRKLPSPDLVTAEAHYEAALRIDPKHRGALEYSGELHLMRGDLAKAEQRLAALDKACNASCEEYDDLKKAVARFKAAGNRHVAAP